MGWIVNKCYVIKVFIRGFNWMIEFIYMIVLFKIILINKYDICLKYWK